MGSKNFEDDYDWSRSLSDRIKGMKDTALGKVWKKGREHKIQEIELLRTYNWLISAGFPQYVQLHRDNFGTISPNQVEKENLLLDKILTDTMLKRINILNQHIKTKIPETTDVQIMTGNRDDFKFSLSPFWKLDGSSCRWTNHCSRFRCECSQEESSSAARSKSSVGKCFNCQRELATQTTQESRQGVSNYPFPADSPARKQKKKNEGKWKTKPAKLEDDSISSDNNFSTPGNSSLTSSEFRANQNCNNSNNEEETLANIEPDKGGTLFFCGSDRGEEGVKFETRKSSLQTELNKSSHLKQQYKNLKNFFRSVGDRITSAKPSKVPRFCTACNGNDEAPRPTNSIPISVPKVPKSATCSDSFLVLDSIGLPGIRVCSTNENETKRCKSENCLSCNSSKRRGCGYVVARRNRYECPGHEGSACHDRRSVTPTGTRCNGANKKALLSLEMPRRRFSNRSNSSPRTFLESSPVSESARASPFRKMTTVPDKMERLNADDSSAHANIRLFYDNPNVSCRPIATGDTKSTTDDSSYYDCFEGSSHCLSDNNSRALVIDDKNDNFHNSPNTGCNESQSEESKKSSHQSLEVGRSFRQKELDSILLELHSKINSLDKIEFNLKRHSPYLDGLPCPHSNSPNASEDEIVFKTFSMEKAKFFNLDKSCLIKTFKTCDKCRPHPNNSKDGDQIEDRMKSTGTNFYDTAGSEQGNQWISNAEVERRQSKLKKDLSLLTASELFVLRKISLIHLTSITDKYLLSNVDNLLAPKPDTKVMERRDSAWANHEKKQKIFGCSLLEVTRNMGQPLPGPIGRALAFLGFVGGDAVGIFRRPGVKNRISEIRKQLDEDPDVVDFHNQSVYDIADLVKLYFRELPGSLFTKEYSQLLINIFSYVPRELHIAALQDIMCLMPDENRIVLKHLLDFLQKLSEHSVTNQMDINNLATCFAPSLFYSNNQSGELGDDSTGSHRCWERNGSGNCKKGQTIPLHHSHPNSTIHRNVHQTSSNSADYVREATEMKDHKATRECLSCLITNAHVVFQVSDELSQAASNFVRDNGSEINFYRLLNNSENCLSVFLKESICSIIHDVDNNLSGWFPISNPSLDIEVYYKPCQVSDRAKNSNCLGVFVASSFIPSRPGEAIRRIASGREQWDDTLLSWKVLEEVHGIQINESELRADIQTNISRMAKNSDIPTIIEENVAGFSGKFDWSKVLGFNSYSSDVVHYTVAFAPNCDLEFCEMRLWKSSEDDSVSILLSTSVDHPSIPLSDDVKCHVIDCRYVVVSIDDVTSKAYFFSRMDIKGHLPSWYEKVYGHLCANHMRKLLASFENLSLPLFKM